LKTFFVPEGVKVETVFQSEPEAFSYKAKIASKPNNSKFKTMTNSDSKTSKIKILKRSEPVPQSLLKPESGILKSKSQNNKTVMASSESELKGVKPKVLINQKLSKPHLKVQEMKSKTSSTNLKGPIKQWVPKYELSILHKGLKAKEKQKSWYLDSGSSRHMTGERSIFLTLTMKEGGNVKFGGNQSARSLLQELLVTPLSLLIMCGW